MAYLTDAQKLKEINSLLKRYLSGFSHTQPHPFVMKAMAISVNELLCPEDCPELSLTEYDQDRMKDGRKIPHMCNMFNIRLQHGIYHPELVKCDKCLTLTETP